MTNVRRSQATTKGRPQNSVITIPLRTQGHNLTILKVKLIRANLH